MKCFLEQAGSIDKNGQPQRDMLVTNLGYRYPSIKKESLEATADKCITEKGANNCETAFKISDCIFKAVNVA